MIMPNFYAIPVQQSTPQNFQILLGGVSYRLSLYYQNVPQGGWTLDIADVSDNPILQGLPLVTGANLLAQYGYLNFGGALWVQTYTDPDAVPTFENLGGDAVLYWVTA
jgi:hypothetical protein